MYNVVVCQHNSNPLVLESDAFLFILYDIKHNSYTEISSAACPPFLLHSLSPTILPFFAYFPLIIFQGCKEIVFVTAISYD